MNHSLDVEALKAHIRNGLNLLPDEHIVVYRSLIAPTFDQATTPEEILQLASSLVEIGSMIDYRFQRFKIYCYIEDCRH